MFFNYIVLKNNRKISMGKKLKKKTQWIYLSGIIPFLTGCTPGPPLPPIFPGFEWLIIGFVVWIGIVLWRKHASAEPLKTHYLTEVLNAINQRLKILEGRIGELEEKKDKKGK